jgi:hypothetical protein
MADPFADALADLHASDLGLDAVYTAPGGDPLPLRVIRSQGSEIDGRVILDQDAVAIRRADVLLPERGADLQLLGEIAIGDEVVTDPFFRISQDPLLDEEGLSWSCAIERAP